MNIVTAYTDTGISLGQIIVDSKSNEIPTYKSWNYDFCVHQIFYSLKINLYQDFQKVRRNLSVERTS